jgi:hypothetical protein
MSAGAKNLRQWRRYCSARFCSREGCLWTKTLVNSWTVVLFILYMHSDQFSVLIWRYSFTFFAGFCSLPRFCTVAWSKMHGMKQLCPTQSAIKNWDGQVGSCKQHSTTMLYCVSCVFLHASCLSWNAAEMEVSWLQVIEFCDVTDQGCNQY